MNPLRTLALIGLLAFAIDASSLRNNGALLSKLASKMKTTGSVAGSSSVTDSDHDEVDEDEVKVDEEHLFLEKGSLGRRKKKGRKCRGNKKSAPGLAEASVNRRGKRTFQFACGTGWTLAPKAWKVDTAFGIPSEVNAHGPNFATARSECCVRKNSFLEEGSSWKVKKAKGFV